MQKDEKILIAGAGGMVGSALFQNLKKLGYTNLVGIDKQDVDLTNQQKTLELFANLKPDYVFLSAAKVGGILANSTYKAEFIYDNLMISVNIINSAKIFGVKKLLNLGSSCIYPKITRQPITEEQLLTGALEPTNEPYAIAKISAIKLCRYYNEQYNTDFISVMPTNLYGGLDNFNLETSHVLPALIRKFLLAKRLSDGDYDWIFKDLRKFKLGFGLDNQIYSMGTREVDEIMAKLGINKNSVTLWGSGKALREFLHVDDLSDASIYLMNNFSYSDIGEFINIGTSQEISIEQLAEKIKEIIEYKGDIIFDASKPDGTPRKLLDISRIRSLGWSPKIKLSDGIKLTIQKYFDEH